MAEKKNRIAIQDLPANSASRISDEEAQKITGGRKTGKDQHEYLVVKLEEVLISSVSADSK